MAGRSERQRERERLARVLEATLLRKIAGIQRRLYGNALRATSNLQTDQDGNLKFTVKNISASSKIAGALQRQLRNESRTLIKWLVRSLLKLFRANTRYFSALEPRAEQREQQILFRVLLRYGYNTKTKSLTGTGVLSFISSNQIVGTRVAEQINQALSAKTTMSVFKQRFRQFFVNPGGLGLLESQFNRLAQDLFQDFDREAQKSYADELDLAYAIYSGTEIKTTRPFCERRINNVYTREEIDKWNSQSWKGKRPNVPVEVQCGGYNCRHHLSYITSELADRLAKSRGGVNNYN